MTQDHDKWVTAAVEEFESRWRQTKPDDLEFLDALGGYESVELKVPEEELRRLIEATPKKLVIDKCGITPRVFLIGICPLILAQIDPTISTPLHASQQSA